MADNTPGTTPPKSPTTVELGHDARAVVTTLAGDRKVIDITGTGTGAVWHVGLILSAADAAAFVLALAQGGMQ